MERLLLVSGDDYGRDADTNAGILGAHREGILTHASMMVTGSALDEAIEHARSLPGLSVGLHLVLCDGRAASPPGRIPDLVDSEGRFPPSPFVAGVSDWWHRRRRRAQLEREIRAQIERYLATGLALDQLDGHHHLHMHPVVFGLLFPCLAEYGIPRVRLVHEDRRGRVRGERTSGELVPAIFGLLSRSHRPRLEEAGVACVERVYGLRTSGRVTSESLLELLPRLSAGTVEIYAHPARTDEAGLREERALCDPRVRRAVEASGYRVVNARDLAPDPARRG